jgi:hypothetical protein
MRTLKYEYSPLRTSNLMVLLAASSRKSLISSPLPFYLVCSKRSMMDSILAVVIPSCCLTSCLEYFEFVAASLNFFRESSSRFAGGCKSFLNGIFGSKNTSSFSLE